MKTLRNFLILALLAVLPVGSFAQQYAIQYTPLAVGSTGLGSSKFYDLTETDNDVIDSLWGVLQSSHLVGSDDVWQAAKISGLNATQIRAGNYHTLNTYQRSKNALWPYQVASAFASSTVTSGAVVLPSGSLGTVAVAQGGTGQTSYTNGQLLIGNTTGNTLTKTTLTGTSNQITVTNSTGSITLSTPQDIAAASTPTFASETLTATTNQLVLGTTRTATISAPTPASASRVYTIPDPGAAASFTMYVAPVVMNSASAAIAIPGSISHKYLVTYNGGAGAYTLAAPTAGTDDYKVIVISSLSAQAHVITGGVDGFNAKGSSGTLTFGGAIGDAVTLMAYNGHWYTIAKVNVTVA